MIPAQQRQDQDSKGDRQRQGGPVTQKVDRTKTGPGVQLWQPKMDRARAKAKVRAKAIGLGLELGLRLGHRQCLFA